MLFRKVLPRNASLMTWEYSANFDEVPQEKFLLEKLSQELPLVMERLVGAKNLIRLWPMISFNSQEGRLFRYLVAIPQDNSGGINKTRSLPAQLGLFAVADQVMKLSDESVDNEGNYFFWSIYRNTLFILVFFEGRLCHWSEEQGYESAEDTLLESRLERFRVFLKQDDLFSRGKNFAERQIDFPEDPTFFFKAAKDPFFRKLNLERAVSKPAKRPPIRQFFLFAAALSLLCILKVHIQTPEIVVPDVLPVKLLDPPFFEIVEEKKEEIFSAPISRIHFSSSREILESSSSKLNCETPAFRIRGIVGGRFALVSDCMQCGKEILSKDDSVGNFVVQDVGRDRLFLSCGNKQLEVTTR